MKNRIQGSLIILLFILPLKISASFEGDTWIRTTPGGNKFFHERCCYGDNMKYSYNISCSNENRDKVKKDKSGYIIQNLSKWYFYKKHIIGEYYPIEYEKKVLKYFTFNECSCKLKKLETKEEFERTLKKENLIPLIARNYRESWGMLIRGDDTIADFLIFLFIKLPLLLIFSIISLIILIKNKLDLKLLKVKIFAILSLLIIIRCFLDIYPNSI